MRRMIAAMTLALAAGTVQADRVGVYQGRVSSYEIITVTFADTELDAGECPGFDRPRFVFADVTPVVAEAGRFKLLGKGCWQPTDDGMVDIHLTAEDSGAAVTMQFAMYNIRQDPANFELWPTANGVTWEPASLSR